MKVLCVCFLFICLGLNINAQIRTQDSTKMHGILPMHNGKVYYSEVIEESNVSKDELYSRAYSWIVSSFKLTKFEVKMSDKGLGKIVAEGKFEHPIKYQTKAHTISFMITIIVKENRFKYIFTDFNELVLKESFGFLSRTDKPIEEIYEKMDVRKKNHNNIITQFDAYVTKICQELKSAIKQNDANGKDDW